MAKLFKKIDAESRRSVRRHIRLKIEEDQQIREAADVRQMDVSEFIRRAALGRRADVSYDKKIVLALSDVVRRLKELHAAVKATGHPPPEKDWLPVILDAREAMLRIEK